MHLSYKTLKRFIYLLWLLNNEIHLTNKGPGPKSNKISVIEIDARSSQKAAQIAILWAKYSEIQEPKKKKKSHTKRIYSSF